MKPKENLLILCAKNSARSQMAEALFRRHCGTRFNVYSAGLEASEIHWLAVKVPGAMRQYSWPFPDPVAAGGALDTKLAAFREVRDGIERRITAWLSDPDVGLVGARP